MGAIRGAQSLRWPEVAGTERDAAWSWAPRGTELREVAEMAWSNLTETTIRQYVEAETFARGREYADRGAVLSLARRGDVLEAEVRGRADVPYHARRDFGTPHLITATCTRPYDWGGWCKHIVAACLVAARHPEFIKERQTLEDLLAGLDAERLRALPLDLMRVDPAVLDVVERRLATPRVVIAGASPSGNPAAEAPAGAAPRRGAATVVDAHAVRREVRGILHSLDRMRPSEAY